MGDSETGTRVDEIADGIYRISTPVRIPGSAFSFNQYLIVDEEPLLFHTGPRKLFPLVHEAVASVLPPGRPAAYLVLARGIGRVRIAQRMARGGPTVEPVVRKRGGHGVDR